MVYLQRTKMIFYTVFIMYFCFKVFLWSLVNFRGYILQKGRMFVNDTKEMEKGTFSEFQGTFPEGLEKTTQTYTRLSVNVIHWHRNLEYLTLLWSTTTFNICLQYTDNCQEPNAQWLPPSNCKANLKKVTPRRIKVSWDKMLNFVFMNFHQPVTN